MSQSRSKFTKFALARPALHTTTKPNDSLWISDKIDDYSAADGHFPVDRGQVVHVEAQEFSMLFENAAGQRQEGPDPQKTTNLACEFKVQGRKVSLFVVIFMPLHWSEK